MDYTHCKFCKSNINHIDDECFFWCSEKCKKSYLEEKLTKRIKDNSMHNPAVRRGETDHTNELMKALLKGNIGYVDSDGIKIGDSTPKGKRRCSKCGDYGHNMRTCKNESQ